MDTACPSRDFQRHRRAAGIKLVLLKSGQALFEVREPGFRQQQILGVTRKGYDMKLTLSIFALVLFIAIPAYAQPTGVAYIQSRATDNDSTTHLSLAFNNPVTPGSLLVVAIRTSNGSATVTITTPNDTWAENRKASGLGWAISVHSAPNAAGGPTTVTATMSGSPDAVRMSIHEYSGVATTSPVHGSAGASATSSHANSGPVTTTINNCLLFSAGGTDTDRLGFVAGSGYTLREIAGEKIASEDSGTNPVPAGTYYGTMNLNSDTWAAILVAYKPAMVISAPTAPTNLHVVP